MSSDNTSQINRLLRRWPAGTVAVSGWLAEQGVYQQLADKYVHTGWLEKVGHGAWRRAGDRVAWTGALYAIQYQLALPVHIGARTALEMSGHGHFVPLGGGGHVSLFAAPGTRLPTWFRQYDWGARMTTTAVHLFGDVAGLGITTTEPERGYTVRLSAPERAMLEICCLVPQQQTFEEARLLMENLATLRPGLVQELLECCTSIKAKRIFLYLAESCGHAWFKRLAPERINLGTGKRMVIRGGRYDATYRITVPKGDGIEAVVP